MAPSVPIVDQGDGNVPTIGKLKAWTERMYALRGGGPEAAVLVPVALSLMLYLSSQEPDLDEIPPSHTRSAAAATLEVLCTKAGDGGLSLGDEPLVHKGAKPLPSSD